MLHERRFFFLASKAIVFTLSCVYGRSLFTGYLTNVINTTPMMRHSAPLMRCAGGGQKKGTLRFCVSEEQNARRKRERCVPLSVGELKHALSRRQATGLSTAAPQR